MQPKARFIDDDIYHYDSRGLTREEKAVLKSEAKLQERERAKNTARVNELYAWKKEADLCDEQRRRIKQLEEEEAREEEEERRQRTVSVILDSDDEPIIRAPAPRGSECGQHQQGRQRGRRPSLCFDKMQAGKLQHEGGPDPFDKGGLDPLARGEYDKCDIFAQLRINHLTKDQRDQRLRDAQQRAISNHTM